jgi:hypothetical protein
MLKAKHIIYKAWQITDSHRKLIWFAMSSIFVTFIIGMCYTVYHGSRIWSTLQPNSELREQYMDTLNTLFNFITSSPSITFISIGIAICFIGAYFLIPLITEGSVITMIRNILNKERLSCRKGFMGGFKAFWRLMEYHILTAYLSPLVILFLTFTVISTFGSNLSVLWYIFGFIFIITSLLTFLFTFSEFFIVLEDKNPIEAIMSSTKLVIFNLDKIALILILFAWVFMRIFINMILFLLFPLIIMGIFYFLGTYFSFHITFALISLVGSIAILFLLYLFTFLSVLKTIIWQLLFQELNKEIE